MSKEIDDDLSVDNSNLDGSDDGSDTDTDSEDGDQTVLYPGAFI